MTASHFSVSSARDLASSAAEELSTVYALRANFSTRAGSARMLPTSPLIFCTISGGVLAGAKMPHHPLAGEPGTPDSATVGTSGVAGDRLAPVDARTRTWPEREYVS